MSRRESCPRLIGRDAELASLIAALETAIGCGTPAAHFVSGEAGIGKTRLLQEFGAQAKARGARVWTGRCLPAAESLIPYVPVVDLLHGIAAEIGVNELRALAGPTAGWLSVLAPELAAEAAEPEAATPPSAGRGRLHAAWWHLVERIAVEPVVLVLEDLHWADTSTRELIAGLASAQRRGRLLVVGTYRDDELSASHPLRTLVIELVRSGAAEQLRLGPLDLEATTQQITAILRRTPETGVAAQIFGRTAGNPFFTEELLASGGDSDFRDTVLNRVRHLPDIVRRILRAVALASHDVEHMLLDEMLGLPRETLHTALRLAVDRQLLVVHGSRYAYRQALVAEAVLADLLPGERIDLHRALAAALESRVTEQTGAPTLAEIAHHWLASHDAEHALPACYRAGVAALRTLAHAEARRQFEHAIDLWERAPQVHDRVPWDLAELYEHAAAAAFAEGAVTEAASLARHAADRCDAGHEPVRKGLLWERTGRYLKACAGHETATLRALEEAVRLVPDKPSAARARVLTGLADVHAAATRHRESQRWAERALLMARRIGSPAEERGALAVSGLNLARLGSPAEGLAQLEEALALAERRGRSEEMLETYSNLSEVLVDEGRLAEAADLGCGHESPDALFLLGRWDRLAGPAESNLKTSLQVARGDFERARAQLDACRRVVIQSVRVDLRASWAVTQAEMLLWQNDPQRAWQTVTDTLGTMDGCDSAVPLARLLAVGARAEADLALAGSPVPHSLDETVDGLPKRVATGPLATAYQAMAQAELARSRREPCAESWALAAEHWARLCCPYLLAYSRWRQAEALLAGRSRRTAAKTVLAESYRAATQLGASPLRSCTRRLAEQARLVLPDSPDDAGAPVPESVSLAGLTDREMVVLRLLDQGLSNRQIGQVLYISEHTVSNHVTHILTKLGAENRRKAVVIAYRMGLLPPKPPQ